MATNNENYEQLKLRIVARITADLLIAARSVTDMFSPSQEALELHADTAKRVWDAAVKAIDRDDNNMVGY